jgi:Tfp pilus assembly protein PilF/4-amino-4-deoxy-L-arabinose transferase-like glycosyltransferase
MTSAVHQSSEAAPATHEMPLAVSRGKVWRLAFVIFVIAFGFRLIFVQGQVNNNPLFLSPILDAKAHDQWAGQIAAGEAPKMLLEHDVPHPYYRAPLYYYFLSIIYRMFGQSIHHAAIVQAVLGSLTCVLIGFIARRLTGMVGMAVGGLLAALYWPFVVFDVELLTVVLEVFLVTATLWTLLHAGEKRSPFWFSVAGLLLGLAVVTRPTISFCWLAVAIWLIVMRRRMGWSAFTAAIGLLFMTVMMSVPILVVLVRNIVVSGDAVAIASSGGINFYIGNNERADGSTAAFPGAEPGWESAYRMSRAVAEHESGMSLSDSQVSRFWFQKGVDWIKNNPGEWMRLCAIKFAVFWSPTETPNNKAIRYFAELAPVSNFFWVGFGVVFVGAVISLLYLKGSGSGWLLIILVVLLYMCGVLWFFVNARFRLPAMPMLILLATLGLTGLVRDIRNRVYGRVGIAAGLAGVAIPLLLINPYHPLRMSRSQAYAKDQAQGRLTLAIHYVENASEDSGHLETAINHLREAVEFDQTLFTAEYLLANLLNQTGEFQEAVKHYENVLQTNPGFMPAHVMYAGLLLDQNQLDSARPLLERAIQLNPADPVPYRMLSRALLDRKQLPAARAVLEHAVQRFPNDPEFKRLLMISRFSPSNME